MKEQVMNNLRLERFQVIARQCFKIVTVSTITPRLRVFSFGFIKPSSEVVFVSVQLSYYLIKD